MKKHEGYVLSVVTALSIAYCRPRFAVSLNISVLSHYYKLNAVQFQPQFRLKQSEGTLKMRDMNLRDMKMRHHVAGVEKARHEFAAPNCKSGNCET